MTGLTERLEPRPQPELSRAEVVLLADLVDKAVALVVLGIALGLSVAKRLLLTRSSLGISSTAEMHGDYFVSERWLPDACAPGASPSGGLRTIRCGGRISGASRSPKLWRSIDVAIRRLNCAFRGIWRTHNNEYHVNSFRIPRAPAASKI